MLDGNDWVASLGDHHKSAAAAVFLFKFFSVVQLVLICSLDNLGQLSNLHGDLADVGGVETEALRISGSFSLVAEDYVCEWQHGGHLVLEELERQNDEERQEAFVEPGRGKEQKG